MQYSDNPGIQSFAVTVTEPAKHKIGISAEGHFWDQGKRDQSEN